MQGMVVYLQARYSITAAFIPLIVPERGSCLARTMGC